MKGFPWIYLTKVAKAGKLSCETCTVCMHNKFVQCNYTILVLFMSCIYDKAWIWITLKLKKKKKPKNPKT